ncbi:uncharacterized protein BJX67DRAFT_199506 [Aspergillus lucknowensis]|uniref:Zn(2)-C6 fungal-type domain-containing protein n=1 Tax=Aspergillus lucknowensis TaxID=176173 RepID=A0ABR4LJU9_9EURO
MEGDIHMDGATRSRKPTPACEKCRILKVRCIRVKDGHPCAKCARSNSQCVVPEPRPRTRLAHQGKKRLVDLESKLSNVIDLLSRSSDSLRGSRNPINTNSGLPAITQYPSPSQDPTSEWMNHEYLTSSNLIGSLGSSGNSNTSESVSERPWEVPTSVDSRWITDLGLSSVVLEHLLNEFRSMTPYFPFVRLPDTLTATLMVEERPFLLLAAVASASSRYPSLQYALIREFKETLSTRVVVAGEKDLDLLQGLLVHLAWFQFHFVPGNQQTYQYLQIAIGMVFDLRLDKTNADALGQGIEMGDNYSREACRAFLGCYYLSTVIAMATGKPNNLRFSEGMLQSASLFQEKQEFETDELIFPLITLQQLTEEVNETYQLENSQVSRNRLHAHAARLKARLEEWWSSISAYSRSSGLVINGYHAAKIRVYEMGLVYRYGQRKLPPLKVQEYSNTSYTPPMIIANLTNSVLSTIEYLEFFFAIPTAEYNSLPISMWYQVILAVTVLYRLSTGLSEVPGWDVDIAQETVDVKQYLGELSSHLQAIEQDPSRELPTRNLYVMMPEIMESVQTSYELAREHPDEVNDTLGAHPSLSDSPRNEPPSFRGRHRCPGLRYLRRDASHTPTSMCSTEQPALQNNIAAEVQRIESDKLWSDLVALDTFTSTAGAPSLDDQGSAFVFST